MEAATVATLLAGALVLVVVLWIASVRALVRRLGHLRRLGRSQATRHGQTMEHFAPLLRDWPWDAKDFRFLGSPVDGVQFTDDGVVFVEIKTGASTLNGRQRRIRDLVRAGRVSWHEVRL